MAKSQKGNHDSPFICILILAAMPRFEKQRLEMLNEGIREINGPLLTLDDLVAATNKYSIVACIHKL